MSDLDEFAVPMGERPELPPEMQYLTPQGFVNFRNLLRPQVFVTKEMLW